MDGGPLVHVDETAPLQPTSPVHYVATKAMAEQLVRAADDGPFETVVVLLRLIWGPTDTTILPGLVDSIRSGRFAWIGGGRHLRRPRTSPTRSKGSCAPRHTGSAVRSTS